MHKRAGSAMLPNGISDAQLGSTAVLCPACPQANTLPDSDDPLLNTMFVMLDGNFRMKCKDRNLVNPSLASGMSYFVKEGPYNNYLAQCGSQREVSTAAVFLLS